MAARISDHIIDEVRHRTDIVDLISDFVPLKKRGKNYFGICPFHHETAPSFSVSPERQIFRCFGCGKGGNVFTFLMEYEKLGFWEALTYLAERAHVALPQKSGEAQRREEYDALFYANTFAAEFYHRMLLRSKAGKRALEYLEKRDFSQETVQKFHLGYAPPGWSNLLEAAQKESVSPGVLKQAGLVVPREKGGGYYDRFRDRVIFPIMNLTGNVIAFGGRLLSESEDQPKYVNSPETPIYNKGKTLYGLFQAKGGIRQSDRVIVVEGYTDVISLHQADIQNVVASSGTAFTSDQARLISRYTKNVLLLFDADTAGAEAALRGVETLFDNGLNVTITSLPPGTDPDSYIREKGKDGAMALLKRTDSFVDFVLKRTSVTHDLKTVEGMARAVETVVEMLAKLKDEVKRSLWIKKISEEFSVDERVIQRSVDKVRRRRGASKKEAALDLTPSTAETAERGLLQLIMADGDLMVKAMSDLTADDFEHPDVREIIEIIFDARRDDDAFDPALIIDKLHRPSAKSLVSLLSMEDVPSEEHDRLYHDYVYYMRRLRISKELREVQEALKKAQMEGDDALILKLTAQFQELSRLREELKKGAPPFRQ